MSEVNGIKKVIDQSLFYDLTKLPSEDNLGAKGNGKISSSLIICGGNKWFYFLLVTNLYILDLITAG